MQDIKIFPESQIVRAIGAFKEKYAWDKSLIDSDTAAVSDAPLAGSTFNSTTSSSIKEHRASYLDEFLQHAATITQEI